MLKLPVFQKPMLGNGLAILWWI